MISTMFCNFKIWLRLYLHITLTLQSLLMLHLQNLVYSLISSLVPSY